MEFDFQFGRLGAHCNDAPFAQAAIQKTDPELGADFHTPDFKQMTIATTPKLNPTNAAMM